MLTLPMALKCPATFCPLFASKGSPWTGDVNADCEGTKCGWGSSGRCVGQESSNEMVWEESGKKIVAPMPPCKFDTVCQWQHEAGNRPCPPRLAVMLGVNPKMAAG